MHYEFLIGQKYFDWKFNFTNTVILYLTLATITEQDVIAFALNLTKNKKKIASAILIESISATFVSVSGTSIILWEFNMKSSTIY